MGPRIVIDTDALVGLLRGDPAWSKRLEDLEKDARLFTTDINAFELYFGANLSEKQEENEAATKGLLNQFTLLSTSKDAMQLAGKIGASLQESGDKIGIKDLLIGSIALLNQCDVLTNNTSEFERIQGLTIHPKQQTE